MRKLLSAPWIAGSSEKSKELKLSISIKVLFVCENISYLCKY